ncbi:MAG: serine/threonine-protein kinase [bacterium]
MARYRFGEVLGGGGFGDVHEAIRTDDDWKCVVKKLKSDATPEDLLRFQREVRLQSQLDHPNIVPISGMNLTVSPPWFVMPRALVNLRVYLQQSHGVEDLWIFHETATGIEYAHNNGIIHRDIKPENILIYNDSDGDMFAAVSDFGLGRLVDRDSPAVTGSDVVMGTIGYAAPEQWGDAKHADVRADVYSLGKTLYEILTGRNPHPSLNLEATPQKFHYIIQKATAEEPDNRYQTVADMVKDVVLVTKRGQDFEKPGELALQMVQNLIRDQRFDTQSIESLARFLSETADDYQMLTQVFPNIPDPILIPLIQNHPVQFGQVFRAYDRQVDEPLAFSYCDVVATFYGKVFRCTEDFDVKTIILRRLPVLGCSHNRYYVGKVYAKLVSELTDHSLILAVRDVLAENPNAAQWCSQYFREISVPPIIRQVVGS